MAPTVQMHQFSEGKPPAPSHTLKLGLLGKYFNVSDAQVSDRNDGVWKPDESAEHLRFENAHPPHSDTLSPGGEPEILDRTAGAVEVGVKNRAPTKHVGAASATVTGYANVDGRLHDPFKFEREEKIAARSLVQARGTIAFA